MKYQFISAIQQGIAAQTSETAGSRRSLSVDLSVEANKDVVSPAPAGKRLTIFGPGDVLGINPVAIIRTEPASNVGDFEPNYFPFVEFGEADFLWRYSLGPVVDKEAGKENEKGIIPWLTLLILESPQTRKPDDETGEFAYDLPSTEELPASIKIRQGTYLPDLSGAWRYAHVQIAKLTGERTEEHSLPEDPAQSICRLFCPRRLKGSTKYTAFVVPTYQAGRLRGVGVNTGLDTAKLSWEKDVEVKEVEGGKLKAVNDLRMPYYHQWEFHTSVRGDFESLVRQLEPRTLSNLGTFPVDVSHPAKNLNACPECDELDPKTGETVKRLIKMEGVLQAIDTEYSKWGADYDPTYEDSSENSEFRNALEELLNPGAEKPTVAPPLYGAWHQESDFTENEGWWRELNLDPRHRYVAGLGDQVIKEHQEAFMAEAWRQLGEIKEANRQVSLGRYGSQISRSVFNRIEKMTSAQQLQMVAPVAHQIKVHGDQDVALNEMLANSILPNGALSANFRRMLRPRGKLGKKMDAHIHPLETLNKVSTILVAKELPQTDQPLATFKEDGPSIRSAQSSSASVPAMRLFQDRIKGDSVRLPWQEWKPIPQGVVIQQSVPESQLRRHRNCNLQGQISGLKDPRSWRGYKVRIRGRRNQARINRKGEFRMKLPDGKHTLYIPEVNIEFDVNISKGIAILLNLELGRPSTVSGQIMGADQRHKTTRKVIVKGTTTTATIGENGAYKLSLPEGDHQLLVQSGGDTHEFTVHAKAGEALLFDVELDQNTKLEATAVNLGKVLELKQLEPAKTIGAVLAKRFDLAQEVALQPLVYEPKFPYPMADFLTEDQLLPGLDRVPRNTVALLETNNRFLEAFMVGLNHAFAGEALWREYPIPLNTTVFQHFWDKEEMNAEQPDVDPIQRWHASRLGDNIIGGASNKDQLVLLLRSDLFRKYPDMLVYLLVKAETLTGMDGVFTKPQETISPIFQGELPPDIAYWGFPRKEEEVRNKNYYIVFEETSLSLRLGLDETDKTDDEVDETDETDDEVDGFSRFSDFNMDKPGDYLPAPSDSDGWNKLSAAALIKQAFVQKPVRLAIALDKLLPKQ